MQQTKPWDTQRYEEKGNRYVFAFAGEKVGSIQIGGDIKFHLNDDFMTKIELWMPFEFTQNNHAQIFDMENPLSLSPLLSLVDKRIVKASAKKKGFLRLEFDDKSTIKAPANSDEHRYEAWQISDRHGYLAVCAVGGEVNIWLPEAKFAK